jgi:Cu(I)/Ag(I) efflux system membrane fusion protein
MTTNKTRWIVALAAVAIVATGYGMYLFGMQRGMGMAPPPPVPAAAVTGSASAATPQGTADGESSDPPSHPGRPQSRRRRPADGQEDPLLPRPDGAGQPLRQAGQVALHGHDAVAGFRDADSDQGKVSVSPRIQQNLGVRTALVSEGMLSPQVAAVGSIGFNERDQAIVQARATGYVERLHVRATLDRVSAGQALVELYVPDWIAAQEEFLSVRRMQGEGLAPLVDGARQRMRQVGMNDAQIQPRRELGPYTQPRITLVAPIGGCGGRTAGTRRHDGDGRHDPVPHQQPRHGVGQRRSTREPSRVAAPRRPRASEKPGRAGRGLRRQGAGDPAEVNAATRTLKARMELANKNGRLVPGMFVQMQFMDMRAEKMLLVPTEAVIQTGKRTWYARRGERPLPPGRCRRRPRKRRPDRDPARPAGGPAGGGVVAIHDRLGVQPARRRSTPEQPAGRRIGERQMIARLIRWAIANRFLVLLATLMLGAWGVHSMLRTPLDALPDLSDVQVIIRTTYPGQAPRIVENQVTYPLTTTMLSVPGAKTVRGYSFFGDSFVYVLFEDGTDLYWARSRVLEYLNQVQSRLPARRQGLARAGRDRVGWIYQYALIDRSGHPRREPAAGAAGLVPQVRAEDGGQRGRGRVGRRHGAPVPGGARPRQAGAYKLPHTRVVDAIQKANQETGGSVLELGEAEYMVRCLGLPAGAGRLPQDPADDDRRRRVGAPGRRRAHPARAGDAARHRRARRRRRSGRRRDRDALGQERARDDRRGEGQAAPLQASLPKVWRSCRPTTARA